MHRAHYAVLSLLLLYLGGLERMVRLSFFEALCCTCCCQLFHWHHSSDIVSTSSGFSQVELLQVSCRLPTGKLQLKLR